MASPVLQPPVPFADFEFSFDPTLSNLFPNPPPLPSSAELFSQTETSDLLGFLDTFGDLSWDLNSTDFIAPEPAPCSPQSYAPYSNPHLNSTPDPSTSTRPRPSTRSGGATRGSYVSPPPPHDQQPFAFDQSPPASAGVEATPTQQSQQPSQQQAQSGQQQQQRASSVTRTSKALLSTPQKRLNHIMSEQKRRNAIRDGYAQLIALLAPAGSAPGIGMPTRGRPKGSGSRGKGQSKGKSGVLFRAVEYCKWLEEGRDSLREEVIRVEAAAGIVQAS
ncbi:hypothetical protein CC1G_00538 [Coprinopsis cinerea okayama7|uniref:BHLH domain-containing protein n=1 Tax=Coprinopsis cinerea (strain Okayama-7 / 130 / ATCC MYA-4618 / FGSC 9003) TaxID=240176 RepID=A8N3B4_COPC7|nr:hypothetical protein CC1G_00538 [Coprinopsis cinerea okayama7\|eukprot:XP_001829359.1 hypothetical protein CC1G_00538 [Coprinopsis cinerea okayama7\